MYSQTAYQGKTDYNPYLLQKINSANPDQLIAYIYDAAVSACLRKDREKARQAVFILMDALNFDYKEIATTFYNVYRHLNRLISRGKFDEAKVILLDLRKTWANAMQVA